MSYSCSSRRNSRDRQALRSPQVIILAVADTGVNSSNNINSQASLNANQSPTAAMKVKKGCNSTGVGVPATTEEELLGNTAITPEDVLGLQKITESKFDSPYTTLGLPIDWLLWVA